jgi:hypothetical protein
LRRITTELDGALFEVVRELAAEQGREDSEVLEDAVSYYLLSLGGSSGHGAVPEERRELARRRLLGLVGAGGLDDEEAQAIAEEAVRRARAEASEGNGDLPAPSPEEVRRRFGACSS